MAPNRPPVPNDGDNGPKSQAQQVAPDAKAREKADPEKLADKGETQFFDGSITKITEDGREVMSDHLLPGEKLRRETTDRYKSGDPRLNDPANFPDAKSDEDNTKDDNKSKDNKNR